MPQDKKEIPTLHAAAFHSLEAGLEAIRRFRKIKVSFADDRAADYAKYQRNFAAPILMAIIDEVENLDFTTEEYVITEVLINDVVQQERQLTIESVHKQNGDEVFSFLGHVEAAIQVIQRTDSKPLITPEADAVVRGIINLVTIGEVLKRNGQITTNSQGDSLRVFLSKKIKGWRAEIKALLLKKEYKSNWFQVRKLTTFKKIIADSAEGRAEEN